MSDQYKTKPLAHADFRSEVEKFRGSARELWTIVTGLAVASILHYWNFSKDSSQVMLLLGALKDEGMGDMHRAFKNLIEAITTIDTSTGKSNADRQVSADVHAILMAVEATGLKSMAGRSSGGGRKSKQKDAEKAGEVTELDLTGKVLFTETDFGEYQKDVTGLLQVLAQMYSHDPENFAKVVAKEQARLEQILEDTFGQISALSKAA